MPLAKRVLMKARFYYDIILFQDDFGGPVFTFASTTSLPVGLALIYRGTSGHISTFKEDVQCKSSEPKKGKKAGEE